ncbi:SCO family protein [Adhaeribacter arboris]|uniref:SCO family protein n=1 Tax=Adhaeribacter arboris TaxID=2072846 RepID=UPI0029370DB4|nr:SCO family protein [Adhaeribacter arboris]
MPILGEREAVQKVVDGKTLTDTIYHQIPDFSFIDQDSQQVTSQTLAGKIYVSDFFFTTCPTICPKMKSQLLRVNEKFKNNDQVVLLSHTIDPQHDSVAVLRDYAERLGVNSAKWHFVTGAKDSIYSLAAQYMVSAAEDENEAGGFVHSGAFILVDPNRHVRGIYDGTNPEQVDQLMKDIPVLLAEKP